MPHPARDCSLPPPYCCLLRIGWQWLSETRLLYLLLDKLQPDVLVDAQVRLQLHLLATEQHACICCAPLGVLG